MRLQMRTGYGGEHQISEIYDQRSDRTENLRTVLCCNCQRIGRIVRWRKVVHRKRDAAYFYLLLLVSSFLP